MLTGQYIIIIFIKKQIFPLFLPIVINLNLAADYPLDYIKTIEPNFNGKIGP